MVIGFVFTKFFDASFWSDLTRSNDVFEASITFGLIQDNMYIPVLYGSIGLPE